MALEAAFELPELSRPRDGGALFTTNKLQFTTRNVSVQFEWGGGGGCGKTVLDASGRRGCGVPELPFENALTY